MATILRKLNDDLTTEFDFNDGVNTLLIGNVDLGEVESEKEWITSPGEQGGVVASSFRPPATMRFTVRLKDTTYDNLLTRLRNMQLALSEGGVWSWQPDTSANLLYLDVHEADLPMGLHGQDSALMHAVKNTQVEVEVTVQRQPGFRGTPQVVANAVAIDNGVLASEVTVTNPGNMDSEAKVTVTVASATAKTAQVRIARRSSGNTTEFATLYSSSIAATGNPDTSWTKLWTWIISPTDSSALAGVFRVFATLKFNHADIYHLQLRWGNVNSDPVGNRNDAFTIDADDTDLTQRSDIDLGLVTFDAGSSALVLQLWCYVDTSGSTVTGDQWTLMPADEQLTSLSSPGQRGEGAFFLESWDDYDELQTSGGHEDNDGNLVLDANGEYGQAPPTNGVQLPVGHHWLTFSGYLQNNSKTKVEIGELQVWKDGVKTYTKKLKSVKNRVWSTLNAPVTIRWDVASGDTSLYKFRVEYTAATSSKRKIRVGMRHGFVPAVSGGKSFYLDGVARQAYLGLSGVRYFGGRLEGPFIKLAPGANVLVFRLGDHTLRGWDGADARERLSNMSAARAATVTIEVVPRYSH